MGGGHETGGRKEKEVTPTRGPHRISIWYSIGGVTTSASYVQSTCMYAHRIKYAKENRNAVEK